MLPRLSPVSRTTETCAAPFLNVVPRQECYSTRTLSLPVDSRHWSGDFWISEADSKLNRSNQIGD